MFYSRATDDQITGIQYDVPFQSNPAYNAEIRPTNYICMSIDNYNKNTIICISVSSHTESVFQYSYILY